VLKGETARLLNNSWGQWGRAAIRITETGKKASMINNIGIQLGDPEEDDNGIAIGTSTPNSKPPATPTNEKLAGVPPVMSRPGSPAPPVLPSYPVGRGISLPFGELLPKCNWCSCSCNALIAWSSHSYPKKSGVLCLDHGLQESSATRDVVLKWDFFNNRYNFISPDHEAAIRAFLA